MKHFDVFNGDADGILALLQLRLSNPLQAELVTGIKRDISLVKKVEVSALSVDSQVTILDISMEKNADGLAQVLDTGAQVFYADHHRAGEIPASENLDAHIDLSADTCSALIVDKLLEGKHHLWAITAAYGDNLIKVADGLAEKAGVTSEQAQLLKELGTLINYNGYGANTDDLAYHPADLFQALLQYSDPFDCIADQLSPYHKLKGAYESDFAKAESAEVLNEGDNSKTVLLEDAAWSRRISGTFGNHLANTSPDKAHIVLTTVDEDNFLVSLRAPLYNKTGAGDICSQFETGGGRAGAAGINKLPKSDLARLIDTVNSFYK